MDGINFELMVLPPWQRPTPRWASEISTHWVPIARQIVNRRGWDDARAWQWVWEPLMPEDEYHSVIRARDVHGTMLTAQQRNDEGEFVLLAKKARYPKRPPVRITGLGALLGYVRHNTGAMA